MQAVRNKRLQFLTDQTFHSLQRKSSNTLQISRFNRPLEVVELNSMTMQESSEREYQGVEGFEIHVYDRYVYTYISDKFQGDIQYDPKLIKVASLDIECECEDGFPEPMLASEK